MKSNLSKLRRKSPWKAILGCILAGFLLWGSQVCQGADPRAAERPSQNGGNFHLTSEKGRLSLVAKNASLREVLLEMGRLTHTDIVVDPNVQGTITTRFTGLTLEQSIKRIAGNWGMVFSPNGDGKGYHISHVVIPDSGPPDNSTTISSKKGQLQSPDDRQGKDAFFPSTASEPAPYVKEPDRDDKNEKTFAEDEFVDKELLVRFRDGHSQNEIHATLAPKGIVIKKYRLRGNYHVLTLPEALPVPEAATWLQAQEGVVFAEPNHIFHTQITPDDTRFTDQWALNDPSIIGAEAGWDLETGRSEVVIAVIDTGVDYTHPDLAANIWRNMGEDWVDNGSGVLEPGNNGEDDDGNGYIDDNWGWDSVEDAGACFPPDDCEDRDGDPMDVHGHGTHVAGIAGAVTDNGIGVAGVAWGCKIMAIRAGYLERNGDGGFELADLPDAIYYAVDNGAHVINMSWGDTKTNPPPDPDDVWPVLKEAIDYASQNGVLMCAAAGNNRANIPFYPAYYSNPEIIAVGSTDSSNTWASHSNFGDWVDVSAPGTGILSTCLDYEDPDIYYCYLTGTSMATPHTSGLAALLYSRFPGWSTLFIKDMILDSVLVVPSLADRNATSGIINLQYALEVDEDDWAKFTEKAAESLGKTGCNVGVFCEGDTDGDGDVDGSDITTILNY